MKSKAVIFICYKGGTGKTDTACNMAAYWAHTGKNVLVVDIDAQGDASDYFCKAETQKVKPEMKTAFRNFIELEEYTMDAANKLIFDTDVENVYLLPNSPAGRSALSISTQEHGLDGTVERFQFLLNLGYDVVVFDCAPDGIYHDAAMKVANAAVITTLMMKKDIQGAYRSWSTLEKRNPTCKKIFVPSKVHLNPKTNKEELDTLRNFTEEHGDNAAPYIPYRDDMGNLGAGKTIWNTPSNTLHGIRTAIQWLGDWAIKS